MKFLPNVVTSAVGRQILLGQKHSPVIMVATGTVGVVVAGVLACRATLKMDEILREAEDTKVRIAKAKALKTEKYNEDDADRDLKVSRIQLAVSIARAYAPAVIIGAAGIALIAGSHIILSRRYAGVTAAYAAVDKAFKDYRQRVIADVGEEKDAEYRYDLVDKEVFVDDEMGGHTETVKVLGENGASMYAICFDEASRNWKPEWSYNQMFLSAQQTWANNKLRADGHVFLNDIYRMLGLPDTKAGAVCGWMDGGDGDDTIIFNIFGPDRQMGDNFVQGNERSVWIDFNVDGTIYDKI
jgi:hypothetical protein